MVSLMCYGKPGAKKKHHTLSNHLSALITVYTVLCCLQTVDYTWHLKLFALTLRN